LYRIGIDIGGTFTDFAVVDERESTTLWKEPSRPADPLGAILAGLDSSAAQLGHTTAELLSDTRLLVHGTTIATNTLIQRNGPRTALICTRGFRDILYFRDAFKPQRFNIRMSPPEPFVERYLRVGVTERIWSDGSVLTPLAEHEVRAAAAYLRRHDVRSVAVSLLWSIVNDAHERRLAEILGDELPDAHIVCSADVLPEIREWERTSATVLSAYILPGIDGYLRRLESALLDAGLPRPPLIMQLNGGCAPIAEILRRPVYALHSGPAAAPAAAAHHARHKMQDLITVDMGGTSFDVCLIKDGASVRTRSLQVEHQPVGVAGVDVHSIGAGGGSIASVDSGGALRVGPRSAGSVPGPAAYGAGGGEPTVTDANIVLGYLAPEAFLGGRRALHPELSWAAIEEHVAQPLGLDVLRAAAGIVDVVNTNMAAAIRAVSLERGYDPRTFTLLCGGGAGGLHAGALAADLGIAEVLIPRQAGTLCAFGMTVTNVRHDYVSAVPALSGEVDPALLQSVFDELEGGGRARLADEGFTVEEVRLERSVDARYPGQVHELTVPVPDPGRPLAAADVRALEDTFHAEHARNFNYARPEMPIELLHWRVGAIGETPAILATTRLVQTADAASPRIGTREVYVAADVGMREVALYRGEALQDGAVLQGPAVIGGDTTTILLGAGDRLTCEAESFRMRCGRGEDPKR
jgi:N-methylhydantoinase A